MSVSVIQSYVCTTHLAEVTLLTTVIGNRSQYIIAVRSKENTYHVGVPFLGQSEAL